MLQNFVFMSHPAHLQLCKCPISQFSHPIRQEHMFSKWSEVAWMQFAGKIINDELNEETAKVQHHDNDNQL